MAIYQSSKCFLYENKIFPQVLGGITVLHITDMGLHSVSHPTMTEVQIRRNSRSNGDEEDHQSPGKYQENQHETAV